MFEIIQNQKNGKGDGSLLKIYKGRQARLNASASRKFVKGERVTVGVDEEGTLWLATGDEGQYKLTDDGAGRVFAAQQITDRLGLPEGETVSFRPTGESDTFEDQRFYRFERTDA